MLLLYKSLFSLLIAGPSWLALLSSGHEIQVRIPVWNVGNIFSNFAKSPTSTTRRPTRPPTRYTRPTRTTTSKKPITRPTNPNDDICAIYPQLPACEEEVTPAPSICDIYPQLPLCQEESKTPQPSICDTYPQLPACQEGDIRSSKLSDVGSLRWNTDPNFCLYYPNLCSGPEESSFGPLVGGQGRSVLLFLPGERGKEVQESGISSSKWLGPTRRPAWQRQSKKETLQSYKDK